MFSLEDNGYSKNEVDSFVKDLKSGYERKLMDLQLKVLESERKMLKMQEETTTRNSKQKNINVALSDALEKAKKIEESSKNIYKLKIQQLNILYSKWRVLLKEMLTKHPEIEDTENVAKLVEELKVSLKMAQKEELETNITTPIQTENDPIRLLLGKMTSYIKKTEEPKEIKQERRSVIEPIGMKSEKSMIKPIADVSMEEDEDSYENLVDKFLNMRPDESQFIINKEKGSNGFDLKEAVNPKEDLKEIMKAFDFYSEDNSNFNINFNNFDNDEEE